MKFSRKNSFGDRHGNGSMEQLLSKQNPDSVNVKKHITMTERSKKWLEKKRANATLDQFQTKLAIADERRTNENNKKKNKFAYFSELQRGNLEKRRAGEKTLEQVVEKQTSADARRRKQQEQKTRKLAHLSKLQRGNREKKIIDQKIPNQDADEQDFSQRQDVVNTLDNDQLDLHKKTEGEAGKEEQNKAGQSDDEQEEKQYGGEGEDHSTTPEKNKDREEKQQKQEKVRSAVYEFVGQLNGIPDPNEESNFTNKETLKSIEDACQILLDVLSDLDQNVETIKPEASETPNKSKQNQSKHKQGKGKSKVRKEAEQPHHMYDDLKKMISSAQEELQKKTRGFQKETESDGKNSE